MGVINQYIVSDPNVTLQFLSLFKKMAVLLLCKLYVSFHSKTIISNIRVTIKTYHYKFYISQRYFYF